MILKNDLSIVLLVLLVLGSVLIFLRQPSVERFMDGKGGVTYCGVNDPCPHPLKCINGVCRKTNPKPLVDPNPVPLLADTKLDPSDPSALQYTML